MPGPPAAVAAFALFPSTLGLLAGNGRASAVAATGAAAEARSFTVEGMTCEGCAAGLRLRLERVPGVAGAEVSYAQRSARVSLAEGQDPPTQKALLAAIEEAGYRGIPLAPGGGRDDPVDRPGGRR